MGFYTSKVKSGKWSMVAFSYVLDMARVNSSTLFALNEKMCPSNKILLSMEWKWKPFILQPDQRRLPPIIKRKIALTLTLMNVENLAVARRHDNQEFLPAKIEKRGRCMTCISELIPGVSQLSLSSMRSACQLCGDRV